jgi:hypothetical protein
VKSQKQEHLHDSQQGAPGQCEVKQQEQRGEEKVTMELNEAQTAWPEAINEQPQE